MKFWFKHNISKENYLIDSHLWSLADENVLQTFFAKNVKEILGLKGDRLNPTAVQPSSPAQFWDSPPPPTPTEASVPHLQLLWRACQPSGVEFSFDLGDCSERKRQEIRPQSNIALLYSSQVQHQRGMNEGGQDLCLKMKKVPKEIAKRITSL